MHGYTPQYGESVRVWAAERDRHFAYGAVDHRLIVSRDEPDIVVVRVIVAEDLTNVISKVPAELFQRVAAGRAILVFDSSTEGAEYSSLTASRMHKLLREVGAPPERTVFLTQNRAWDHLYQAFCRAMNVEPIHVINYDYFIRNFFREAEATGAAEFAARLAGFRARSAGRDRRFVCLNRSARSSKTLLLLKLIEGGQFDQGFVSFPGFNKASNPLALKKSAAMLDLMTVPGLEDVGADLAAYIDQLAMKHTPPIGDIEGEASGRDAGLDVYCRAWFTIVTETECWATRRVTEKPLKPLANFSPFVLWGNPGSLALIRDMGFRTFGEAIDESYDSELDRRRRFAMVYEEIARLCALSDVDLARMEAALAETLTFNARHALVTMPATYREVLEPQLVDRLMDIRSAPVS